MADAGEPDPFERLLRRELRAAEKGRPEGEVLGCRQCRLHRIEMAEIMTGRRDCGRAAAVDAQSAGISGQ